MLSYNGEQPGCGGGYVGKTPLDPFCHLSFLPPAPAKKFFFHQKEVKQPHCRDKQRPNIMNYLGPPEAPDHLHPSLFARTVQPLWQEL